MQMDLHEDVSDGLINVAAYKYYIDGGADDHTGYPYQRDHHYPHEYYLEDSTIHGFACGSECIVLCPVPHSYDGKYRIYDYELRAEGKAFTLQIGKSKNRRVQCYQ